MGISIKLDPLNIDIVKILDEIENPTLRSYRLAEFAREEIGKADDINRAALGRRPRKRIFVDTAETDRLEQVRPDGTITAVWSLFEEVIQGIGDMLRAASPVGTRKKEDRPGHPGLYRASHVLLADGDAIEWEPGEPLPAADEYAFVSSVPYARKIERGLSRQAPDGVYQTVATAAAARFGNIGRITFGYRSPLFGDIHGWASTTPMASPGRRGAKRDEWLRRQPAVIVTVR